MSERAMSQEVTKPSIEIERAHPDDAAAIFDVQRLTWLATYPNDEHRITRDSIHRRLEGENGELIPQKVEWWRRGIETAGTTRQIFVAKDADQIVGYVSPAVIAGQRRIGGLYVLPEAQGKGVGSRLIQEALQWHGRDEDIYLHVASYNQSSINFYRRFGFEETRNDIEDEVAAKNGSVPIPEVEMVLKAER